MKRTAGLFVVFLLCSMIALHGQSQSQSQDPKQGNRDDGYALQRRERGRDGWQSDMRSIEGWWER